MSPILPKITVSTGVEKGELTMLERLGHQISVLFLHYTVAIYTELRKRFLRKL